MERGKQKKKEANRSTKTHWRVIIYHPYLFGVQHTSIACLSRDYLFIKWSSWWFSLLKSMFSFRWGAAVNGVIIDSPPSCAIWYSPTRGLATRSAQRLLVSHKKVVNSNVRMFGINHVGFSYPYEEIGRGLSTLISLRQKEMAATGLASCHWTHTLTKQKAKERSERLYFSFVPKKRPIKENFLKGVHNLLKICYQGFWLDWHGNKEKNCLFF